MGYNSNLVSTFLFVATLCVLLPQASAFGAGDIPDFAYLNDKAFRHGDIESVLEKLAKTAGRASIGGSGIIGIAASVIKAAAGPSKFSKSDIKKVYFGNWLRDYSQAMDIAGLTKLSSDTLVLIVSVLGFMTFGFSTQEFEVTPDRLGVYLPVEHIDNPKGYAEKEGDARQFHPKLRPPVQNRELEIDPNNGMKKYMATENQGWDTSTAFIRRTFRACIEAGRRANGQEGAELWEAYRLLGTGLHTMEDLLAHSNWCEIALRKMGHREVFCHVGDRVTVNTPNGPAPPLVTGTFGGADFLHSLLGEAGDKLSQASVTELSNKMSQAQQSGTPDLGALKNILSKIMGGDSNDKLNQGEQMQQQAQGYNFDPNNVCPPEVMQRLVELLKWHDDVMRQILKKIEMVPGLASLLEEFSNALNAYIYTILAPYVTPLLTQATSVLDEGSKAVIDNHDQYEVFDNPNASDPSHSLLSKDHFGLILNEPAGKIAQLVVEYSVNIIVEAWSNNDNPDQLINQILEAFHHPYYNTGRSQIQHKMFNEMERWLGGLGPDEAKQTIAALTKESVRDHKNKRLGSEDQNWDEPGYRGCGHGAPAKYSSSTKPSNTAGYAAAGAGAAAAGYAGAQYESHSGRQDSSGYGRQNTQGHGGGRQDSSSYGSGRQEGYGGSQQSTYGSSAGHQQSGYGVQQQSTYGSGGQQQSGYGSQEGYGRTEQSQGYGKSHKRDDDDNKPSYGGGYGGRRDDDNKPSYGGGRRDDDNKPSYGGGRRDDDVKPSYGTGVGYGGRRDDDNKPSYGGGRRDDDNKPSYGGGYGGRRGDDDKPSYGVGGYGSGGRQEGGNKPSYGGGRRDDDNKPSYGSGGHLGDDNKPSYGGGRLDDNKPSYGGGYGGRRDDDDDKPKYGGVYGKKDDDDDRKPKYGKKDDDDKPKWNYGGKDNNDDKPKYGAGYGHQRDDSDDKPKYGGGYGGRRDDDDEDDKKKKKKDKYKSDDSDDERKKKIQSGYAPAYGGGGYGGQSSAAGYGQSGYTPSYGGRDDTYGAERMKIGDDSDDEKKKKKKQGRSDYY